MRSVGVIGSSWGDFWPTCYDSQDRRNSLILIWTQQYSSASLRQSFGHGSLHLWADAMQVGVPWPLRSGRPHPLDACLGRLSRHPSGVGHRQDVFLARGSPLLPDRQGVLPARPRGKDHVVCRRHGPFTGFVHEKAVIAGMIVPVMGEHVENRADKDLLTCAEFPAWLAGIVGRLVRSA